jgi:hypothetical protein
VIEQQYFKTWSGRSKRNRGTEANVDAIKIAEAVYMWLLDHFPFHKIVYYSSSNKTQVLGAPKKLSKPKRKKWAEKEAREIYRLRQDQGMMEVFALQDRIFRKRLDSNVKIQSFIDSYPFRSDEEENVEDCISLAEKVVRDRQKLDDIADACLEVQAFKFQNFVISESFASEIERYGRPALHERTRKLSGKSMGSE